MKKLFLYIFFVLIICNVGFAINNLIIQDIKINTKVTDYFSNKELKEYNSSYEKYGTSKKYSLLYFDKDRGINEKFNDNFDIIMISYNNNTWKIEYVAGVIEDLKNCIKFREEQAKLYKDKFKKYRKEKITAEHADGLKQEVISYEFKNLKAKLTCDIYPDSSPYAGTIDFRIDYLTDSFNTWVVREEGTTTN